MVSAFSHTSDRKSTRLNSSHLVISYAVFCLKKKLLARGGPAVISSWKERGAALLAKQAPRVEIRWFDTPHDIPLFAPTGVAAEIERASSAAAASPGS